MKGPFNFFKNKKSNDDADFLLGGKHWDEGLYRQYLDDEGNFSD